VTAALIVFALAAAWFGCCLAVLSEFSPYDVVKHQGRRDACWSLMVAAALMGAAGILWLRGGAWA
jgi:hypothetical protein